MTGWPDIWLRFRRQRAALAGLAVIALVLLLALLAGALAPYDPVAQDYRASLKPPGGGHLLGTDVYGRDVLSRLLYGSRVSLLVGSVSVLVMMALGLPLGGLAGYYGRYVDSLIMRTADVFFAFPYLLGAVAVMTVLGPGLLNLFVALGLVGWAYVARVFRASVLELRDSAFVEAARLSGAGDLYILRRHVLPNAVGPVLAYAFLSVGSAILTESVLSFLGIGLQPPYPSWGTMLSESGGRLLSAPWLIYAPGVAITITVLAFVLVADGLRDALDPRSGR